jgi:porin
VSPEAPGEKCAMKHELMLLSLATGLLFSGSAAAGDSNDVPAVAGTGCDGTLTHGFWGLNDALADYGIEVALGVTNVYQANVRNGLDTHRKSGRYTGSYDLEIAADLEKLAGLEDLGFFLHGEGGGPDAEGIDETTVGSAFGVNGDAMGDRTLDITEAFLEWGLWDGGLTLRIGKMDFAGVFDTSAYANDETSQFLNGALVNNPMMPLLNYYLGATATLRLSDAWYASAGIGDAEGDSREIGLRTAFCGADYFFYVLETGVRVAPAALPGNYRAGLWYDPQPKACAGAEREYRDDAGVYASVDQTLFQENPASEDCQGLGAFGRYGYADGKRNDLTGFWSVGLQYQGLVESRDDDVLALGFAQGEFTDNAAAPFTANSEKVVELYYAIAAASWLAITPDVQYVAHPAGDREVPNAIVAGVRAQIAF